MQTQIEVEKTNKMRDIVMMRSESLGLWWVTEVEEVGDIRRRFPSLDLRETKRYFWCGEVRDDGLENDRRVS